MRLYLASAFILLFSYKTPAQLGVARDTFNVVENGYSLKMAWANGINYANVSNVDFNGDGKKDLLVYDKINQYGAGSFRCFINSGNSGEIKYKDSPWLASFFPPVLNWAVMRESPCSGKNYLFCSSGSDISVYAFSLLNGNPAFQLLSKGLIADYNPNGNPYLVNIYANPVSVPGIADVDHDGDLDILTFSSQGLSMEYLRNMSKELYNHCDSFVYDLGVYCWGNLSENSCMVSLNDCSQHQVTQGPKKVYHYGSCLSCIDSDSDGDQDLLMGDVSCGIVHYVHNTGDSATALFTDTTQLYPNYPSKGSTKVIQMNSFPCAYVVDADGNSRKDLIVAPNAFGSENARGMWLYLNTSNTGTVNFSFVKENFLQDEMIEVGNGAFPVLIDVDADQKKDLLIGNFGYYVNGPNPGSIGRLTLYKNTGTSSQPSYSLVTRDYAGLSSYTLGYCIPAVGDIDGDNDNDLLIGTFSGQVHWLENTGGQGNPCNFSNFKINPFTFTTTSGSAAPQLYDLDADGLLDLLIGMKNGRISYYRNTGTKTIPSFSLVTNYLGNVDVKGDMNIFLLDGFATPFFYQDNGTKLLVGSVSGSIKYYSVTSPTVPFVLLSAKANNINEGSQASVCYEDLNGDGKRDLLVGNAGGGLSVFTSNSVLGIESEAAVSGELLVYPNPADDEVTVDTQISNTSSTIKLIDIIGKEVVVIENVMGHATINTSALPKGIYVVMAYSERTPVVKHKMIVIH